MPIITPGELFKSFWSNIGGKMFTSFPIFRAPNSERGAAMLEYALMAALIALVAIGGVGMLGREASGTFEYAGRAIETSGQLPNGEENPDY